MRSIFVVAFLSLVLGSATLTAQPFALAFAVTIAPPLVFPPVGTGGAAGACGNPANVATHTIGVGVSGEVLDVNLSMTMAHTFICDLRITLAHCGVTVVLYDRNPCNGDDLAGTYVFDDEAAGTFAAAITAAGNFIASGTYSPVNPLSAFDGLNAAGPWTITLCDLAVADVGNLSNASVTITYNQDNVGDTGLPLPFPPVGTGGAAGGCGNPSNVRTRTVNFPVHGPVGYVLVDLNLSHTFTGDLQITLTHAGITRRLFNREGGTANFVLGGDYDISDFFPYWGAAAIAAGGGNVAFGNYSPLDAFWAFNNTDMFGPWTLTICDLAGLDVGTLANFNVRVVRPSGFSFQLAQPGGGAGGVDFLDSGGTPGNGYHNLITFTPGAYPFGWFFGIDISIPDLLTELSLPPPFNGALDACGRSLVTIPGPIPAGIPAYCVGLETNPSIIMVDVTSPFFYLTIP